MTAATNSPNDVSTWRPVNTKTHAELGERVLHAKIAGWAKFVFSGALQDEGEVGCRIPSVGQDTNVNGRQSSTQRPNGSRNSRLSRVQVASNPENAIPARKMKAIAGADSWRDNSLATRIQNSAWGCILGSIVDNNARWLPAGPT